MAGTIQFDHCDAGAELTLKVYPLFGGEIVNPASLTCTVINAAVDPLSYQCVYSETIGVGWYRAKWFEAGELVGSGLVYLAGSGVDRVGATAFTVSEIASAVWNSANRTLTSFASSVRAALGFSEEDLMLSEQISDLQDSVDDIASGNADWTAEEKKQIRYRLGLDGTTVSPVTSDPHFPVTLSLSGLAQLAGKRTITILRCGILVGNDMLVIQGDSYLAANDNPLDFPRSDFPDLAGTETVRLRAEILPEDGTPPLQLMGSIHVATGAKVLRFEPTSTETSAWQPGTYRAKVEVIFAGGNVREFQSFTLKIAPDIK